MLPIRSQPLPGRKRLRQASHTSEEEDDVKVDVNQSEGGEESSDFSPSPKPISYAKEQKSSKSKSTESPKSKSKTKSKSSSLPSTSIFARPICDLVSSDDDFEQPSQAPVKSTSKPKRSPAKSVKPAKPAKLIKSVIHIEEYDDVISISDSDEIEDDVWTCKFCDSVNSIDDRKCIKCSATFTPSESVAQSRLHTDEDAAIDKTNTKSRSRSKSLSKGKRKSQDNQRADFDSSSQMSLSQTLGHAADQSPKDSVEDWCVKYAPRSVEDLAVHAKKIAQVRDWFDHNICGSARSASPAAQFQFKQSMLILTGPPGCCKSTMVETLAAARGVACARFEESLQPRVNFSHVRSIERDGESLLSQSKLDMFEQFLLQSTRYSSLITDATSQSSHKRMVLIDELPFVGEDRLHQRFLSIIQTALYQSNFALVLCLSDMHEDSGAFAVEQLLTSAVLSDPHVAHIECNAVNNTLMAKVLKRIIEKARLDVGQDLLDTIIARARGDLRQAIQTLQFEFQHKHPLAMPSKAKSSRSRPAKVKSASPGEESSANASLQSSARDSSASLLHSVGRILYAKRDKTTESIIDRCADEMQIMLPMIQQNYIPFFRLDETMDHVVAATHSISQADYGITEDFTADSFRDVSLWLLCEDIVHQRSAYKADHPDSTAYRPGQSGLLALRGSDALRVPRIVTRKKLLSTRYDTSVLPKTAYFTETLPYSELVRKSTLGESFRLSQNKEIRSLPSAYQTEIVPQMARHATAPVAAVVEEDPIEDT